MRSQYNEIKSTYYPDKELIIVRGNGFNEYLYVVDVIREQLCHYGFELKVSTLYPYEPDFIVEFIKKERKEKRDYE